MSFVNKDFNSIWTEFLELVPKLTRKWMPSEANESDPMAVALKLIAIALDKGNYAIDKSLLELYPLSLTQEASAYRVYDALNYKIRWYESARGEVTVRYVKPSYTFTDTNPSLEKFDMLTNSEGDVIYTVVSDTQTLTDNTTFVVDVLQGAIKDFVVNGQSMITTQNLDSENKLYFPESNVAQNGIFVVSDDTYTWEKVDNLPLNSGGNRVYTFGLDTVTNTCYIQFPKDVAQLCGAGFTIKYLLSEGTRGSILRGDLNSVYTSREYNITTSEGNAETKKLSDLISVYNNAAISNGKDPEDIDEMYSTYKKTANLLNTLVTMEDYRNYITTYISSNSNKLVSNCQISDRTCDLYNSHIVKSMNTSGQFTDVLRIDDMTAFDLRLYPLQFSSSDTLENYNKSFRKLENSSSIQDTVSSVKSVNHDFKEDGNLFIPECKVNGIIYLESKVSQRDARDVLQNVYTALYSNFNSSKLSFGEEVSYSDIVDVIQNADQRIKYVALSPLSDFSTALINSQQNLKTPSLISNQEIYKRSVLKGVTPWAVCGKVSTDELTISNAKDAQENQFVLDYSQTFKSVTDIPSKREYGNVEYDTYLVGGVKISGVTNQQTLKVQPNMQLHFVSPQYRAATTYSNYLYYKANFQLSKDVIYTLQSGDYIHIFTNRDDASKDLPTYTIKGGTQDSPKVQANFSISKYVDGETIPSLSPSQSISVMERVSTNSYTEGDCVYFSSKDLFNRIVRRTGSMATLLYGDDFVVYYNKNTSNFELLSSGTSVYFGNIGPYASFEYTPADVSLSNLEETGDLSSLESCWMPISSAAALTRASNNIISLGEGYSVKTSLPSGWKGGDLPLKNGTSQFSPVNIADIKGEDWNTITYYLDSETSSSLPSVGKDDICYMFASVDLSSSQTSPMQVSKYTENGVTYQQFIGLYSFFEDSTEHSEWTYYPNGEHSTVAPSSTATSFQPSVSIITKNGIQLVDEDFQMYFYSSLTDNVKDWMLVSKGNFAEITENTDITFPGDAASQILIVPYIPVSSEVVQYLICTPGTTKSFSQGVKIGAPYTFSKDSYYRDSKDGYKFKLLTTLSDQLTTDQLYDSSFSPVYQVPENILILYPQEVSSFFNKQHVVNRYTLEKLVFDEKSLYISPLSIK